MSMMYEFMKNTNIIHFNKTAHFHSYFFIGYDQVVVKNMAFYLKTRTVTPNVIPEGYVHIFLIRHPAKSILSFYKLVSSGEMEGVNFFYSFSWNFYRTV